MSKKAQGMSMNVIIIAALALLVLVILAIIFIGRMGKTTQGVDSCQGSCVSSESECTAKGSYYKVDYSGKCYQLGTSTVDTSKVCCIGV
jgi:hypothetical protein